MRLLCLAVFAGLVACGQYNIDSHTAAPPTPSYKAELAAKVTGHYAVRMQLATTQDAPVVGKVSTVNSLYQIADIAWDGVRFTVKEQSCKIAVDAGNAPIVVTVNEKAIRSVVPKENPFMVYEEDGAIHFKKDMTTIVMGAQLANIEKDALPTKSSDPRLVDIDRDGHPGGTARAKGTIKVGFLSKKVDAEIYFVQRSRTGYEGVLTAPGQLEGLVEDTTEQSLIGSDSALLKMAGNIPSKQDDDKSKSTIRFVKIPDGAGCDQVSWDGIF